MLLIVLVHANYFSLGFIDSNAVRTDPVPSVIRIFFEQLCVVGVNVFVLISGWFGIKPTVKGGISVLYQVFFYGLLVMCLGLAIGLPVPKGDMVRLFWLGGYYWYMPAYLGLYAFSPVLNTYMEHAAPRIQLGVLFFFFVFEFAFGWLTKLGTYNAGFSSISFIGLYLLAGFVRNHSRIILQWSPWRHISVFLGLILLSVVAAFLDYKYLGGRFEHTAYSSPFVISASLFLLLAFANAPFQNKAVNWIACSVFSIWSRCIRWSCLTSNKRWEMRSFGWEEPYISCMLWVLPSGWESSACSWIRSGSVLGKRYAGPSLTRL